MSKYLSLGHSKTRIYYHIIFATKYRKKLLSPIREQLFSYLKNVFIIYYKADIPATPYHTNAFELHVWIRFFQSI